MENNNDLNNSFSRSLMAGFFTGLLATVICLLYNLFFRGATEFNLSSYVNVSTIIFVIPFILLFAGFIYYTLKKYRTRNIIFVLLLILFLSACILADINFQRSPDPLLADQFRKLMLGIIAITGLSALFIPYLATHETSII